MIHWNVNPIMIELGSIQVHWYGVCFGTAFLLGQALARKMCVIEGKTVALMDKMLGYVVVGTLAGARVGHCLFYEPDIYLRDPLRILKIWEGGLASHGGGIGIFLMLWIFARKYREFSYLWLLDHLCVGVMMAGFFIRMGNLFNSEILGRATTVPWAFVFDRVDEVPRHPAQLYEALCYIVMFGGLWWWYRSKSDPARYPGRIFGVFLILCFGVRSLIEFIKEDQVSWEAGLPLNMGQLLSIPMIATGAWLVWRSTRVPPVAVGGARNPDVQPVSRKSNVTPIGQTKRR